jgi:hypothetical protein
MFVLLATESLPPTERLKSFAVKMEFMPKKSSKFGKKNKGVGGFTPETPKEKELKTMKKYIFEIRNTKTNAAVSTTAPTYNAAIKALGWKPQDCRLCWKCPA